MSRVSADCRLVLSVGGDRVRNSLGPYVPVRDKILEGRYGEDMYVNGAGNTVMVEQSGRGREGLCNRQLPQLDDRSMISLGAMVIVMPIQQYSQ